MQITFKDKPATITAGKARADPPSLEKLWRDRRKSAVPRRDEQHILRRPATP
jgi:hypothetical protein